MTSAEGELTGFELDALIAALRETAVRVYRGRIGAAERCLFDWQPSTRHFCAGVIFRTLSRSAPSTARD